MAAMLGEVLGSGYVELSVLQCRGRMWQGCVPGEGSAWDVELSLAVAWVSDGSGMWREGGSLGGGGVGYPGAWASMVRPLPEQQGQGDGRLGYRDGRRRRPEVDRG
jgi:hypothetical protein